MKFRLLMRAQSGEYRTGCIYDLPAEKAAPLIKGGYAEILEKIPDPDSSDQEKADEPEKVPEEESKPAGAPETAAVEPPEKAVRQTGRPRKAGK